MSKKQRHIKVYPKYMQRTYKSIIVPEIRLSGLWLQESGFEYGQDITVETEKDRIIISKKQKE